MDWTEQENQMLVDLWDKGATASEISRILTRFSREAVCGKARRMKLASRKLGLPPPITSSKISRNAEDISLDDSLKPLVSHEELTTAMCQWPTGDPRENVRFCGRPGYPYCDHHHKRAYRDEKSVGGFRHQSHARPGRILLRVPQDSSKRAMDRGE